MFKLTLRAPSTIPLELDGITPERVANLSPLEVAKLPVQHGNQSEPLGEFFEVTPDRHRLADLHFAGDTRNVKHIGAGMTSGSVFAEGPVGLHAGAPMIAGTLVLLGEIGERCGAGMKRGTILTAREPLLPPSFRAACEYRPTFLALYLAKLRDLGVNLPPTFGVGTVRCFRGDLLTGGNGEVLVGRS